MPASTHAAVQASSANCSSLRPEALENSVAPMYANPAAWAVMQRHCVAINGTFFNTHRMLGQYVSNAYYPPSASIAASNQVVVDDEAHVSVLV